jgi:hypothetical protein
MGRSLLKSRVLATETEQEIEGQSFLARCRAIVSASSPSISNVPQVLKSRGQSFKPRTQQKLPGSRLQLHTTSWNEKAVRKTETVLGVVLILIAALILGLQQNGNEGELTPAAALPISQPATSQSDAEQELGEMPYFFDMLGATSGGDSAASQSAQLVPPGSSFRSYANPEQFFSFEKQASNMISTQAVDGIASHVERRLLNAPSLVGGLPHQLGSSDAFKGSALPAHVTSSISPARIGSSSAPMCGVMNGFRQLSQILDESCADGQFAAGCSEE